MQQQREVTVKAEWMAGHSAQRAVSPTFAKSHMDVYCKKSSTEELPATAA
jgi:hypothetical protein